MSLSENVHDRGSEESQQVPISRTGVGRSPLSERVAW